ncbi:hypothetical protein EDB69_4038 [Vibrio crassostreae]|uniref:Uncharacterized protein n=1 Tax=Vibrio lentus TaxID=136468 RepID=A0A855IW08_9VIBR|nr:MULTISPECIES: hypothetical protein [Vibrio]CAH6999343.1 conserved hypothetical protein [Vibrio chagasii]PMM61870.1 hypothetical protein BCT50_17375 [Vibrio lentus]RPE87969.1 hypothetical protein EDB68_4115 [Vibrio crassostreae]RPF12330.1 hypothetical protein EDB69_4038 [Vibrio crassostreae]CAK3353055.1 conserved hypothetical protein [Vibrio crassostreae]
MKQLHTLNSGEAIKFNAGQAGKYLIMREASNTVMLRGDALRPVEIERGDTVDITRFDELELFNHKADAVTIEYQIADVPIITKAQKIDISNSVAISEILTPITVDKVLSPIKVGEVQTEVKTRIQNDVLKVEKLADLYTLQKVGSGLLDLTSDEQIIDGKAGRKGLFIQASTNNASPVLVQGLIDLTAGGHTLIQTDAIVTLQGAIGDSVKVGEFI